MFAVLYIPDFALQAALRLDPALRHAPVALIDPALPKTPVIQLTQAARERGVAEGLTPTQARARFLSVVIAPRSLAQEKAATDALLQCAYGFSPDLEATADGVVTLDLKGFKNLPLQAYAQRMVTQAGLLNLRAQVGVAAHPLLALYAACRAQPVLVLSDDAMNAGAPAGQSDASAFLNSLPIEAIEPSPETLDILKHWGIRTLGSFVALGEEALAERLGVEGRTLFERATVRKARPLRLVKPDERFEESIEFEHEIETTEPLLFVLRRFVEQIARRMAMTGRVAETLTLRLKYSGGPDYEHVFKVPEPTSNDPVLFRMLHTHLENFKSEHAIVGLQLAGMPCVARVRQFGLFEASLRDPHHFSEMLARLSGLVGADCVGTPVAKASHQPDAFEMKAVDFESSVLPPERGIYAASTWTGIATSKRHECRAPEELGLPLRRFRPPLPAQLEFRDAQPALIRSKIFTGAIADARGPFFASGNWWDNSRWAREEWDVQTSDGLLLRIFRSSDGGFVEGVYD